jgi:phage/plasmid-like protein (TIGR03299 family)
MHEISLGTDGGAEIVTGGGVPPWHGLGETVPGHMTVWAALEKAGLTWTVDQVELTYSGSDLRTRLVDTHVANVRSDDGRLLGVVGCGYQPVQHRDQAEFIETLVGEGGAVVECLGAIREGRRQFWTLRLPDDLIIGHDDRLRRYLVVANGHDGTLSLRAFWTAVRVVCSNTLTAALRDAADGVTIRHTANVRARIEHAKQVLGLAGHHFDRLSEVLAQLAAVDVDDTEATAYFEHVIPFPSEASDLQRRRVEDTRRQLVANFQAGVGADIAGRTGWGLHQAVTEWTSHQRAFRGATPRDQAERRFESLLLGGPAHVLEQRAFDAALRLARAA